MDLSLYMWRIIIGFLPFSLSLNLEYCNSIGAADGYYGDPEDCHAYYRCVNFVTYHTICSLGTAYDPSILACNYIHLTACSQPPVLVAATFKSYKHKHHPGTIIDTLLVQSVVACARECKRIGECASANFFKAPSGVCVLMTTIPTDLSLLTDDSTVDLYLQRQ